MPRIAATSVLQSSTRNGAAGGECRSRETSGVDVLDPRRECPPPIALAARDSGGTAPSSPNARTPCIAMPTSSPGTGGTTWTPLSVERRCPPAPWSTSLASESVVVNPLMPPPCSLPPSNPPSPSPSYPSDQYPSYCSAGTSTSPAPKMNGCWSNASEFGLAPGSRCRHMRTNSEACGESDWGTLGNSLVLAILNMAWTCPLQSPHGCLPLAISITVHPTLQTSAAG